MGYRHTDSVHVFISSWRVHLQHAQDRQAYERGVIFTLGKVRRTRRERAGIIILLPASRRWCALGSGQ